MVQDQVHGNLSHAMRDNYNEHGVDEYYRKVSATYRNPFFPGIKTVIFAFMNRWWEQEGKRYSPNNNHEIERNLRILDMAAGSGEATLCLLEWESTSRGSETSARSNSGEASSSIGGEGNSRTSAIAGLPAVGAQVPLTRAPFIPPNARNSRSISRPLLKSSTSGHTIQSPRAVLPTSVKLVITATDPFTVPAYTSRTSRPCYPLSFTDLANGSLPPDSNMIPDNSGVIFDLIICSFALHLVTSSSELFSLCYELSTKTRWLVIIAPHKKPEIKEGWGWERWDIASWKAAGDKLYAGGGRVAFDEDDKDEESALEIVREKVKLRLYRSTNVSHP